jgi:hypothetical protein
MYLPPSISTLKKSPNLKKVHFISSSSNGERDFVKGNRDSTLIKRKPNSNQKEEFPVKRVETSPLSFKRT